MSSCLNLYDQFKGYNKKIEFINNFSVSTNGCNKPKLGLRNMFVVVFQYKLVYQYKPGDPRRLVVQAPRPWFEFEWSMIDVVAQRYKCYKLAASSMRVVAAWSKMTKMFFDARTDDVSGTFFFVKKR